jgi:thiol-disulfide isomerase/thioredoxin
LRRREAIFSLAGAAVSMAAPGSKLAPLDEAGFQKVLASSKGKVVLFNFWATWCDPCREEMPLLAKLDAKLRPRGLNLITVSADEPEDEGRAREFLAKVGMSAPAYLKQAKSDENFINAIDPKWSGALPATFLYDKTGKKARSFIGETEMSTIETAIAKLL